MATEAFASEKLKEFKFRIEINGFIAAYVQEFDAGSTETGVISYAGAGQNFPVNEAGMLKFSPAVLRHVVAANGPGQLFFQEWMDLAQNPETGSGQPSSGYYKNFTMYELDNSNNPVIATEFSQAWVHIRKPGNRSAMSENKAVIPEISITYNYKRERKINASG